ncbi:WG containing repeat-containing protein [Flavobacterium fluvii]|uniref:WG containing repeat-containing protein n=1 Tax=Flavobacterium fluvii TaxID=468056 RepID=A0A1M5DUP3_9FLAO|nr:WG repeat-containing protein [Flavobacterium fluvii]SHF70646.1 WG containing repeat-containing protein [Flavobacterium fluvii]
MKKLFTICLLTIITFSGKAQGLESFESEGKYGFKNNAGDIVLPAIYQSAEYFQNGLGLVGLDNKYGFIDNTGAFIIPNIYDEAISFYNDITFVTLNKKVLSIDKNGKVLSVLKYDGLQDRSNRKQIGVKLNGKLGLIDYKGNEITPPIYDLIWPRKPSVQFAFVCLNNKMGVIDINGKLILPLIYDYVTPFNDYYINRIQFYKAEVDGKFGVFDEFGKELLPNIYDKINHQLEGKISVQLNGKIGYYDFETKKIIYKNLSKEEEQDWITDANDTKYRLSKIKNNR